MRSLTTLLSPLLLLLLAAQAKAFDLKGVAIGDPWEPTTIQKKLRIKLRAGEWGSQMVRYRSPACFSQHCP